MSALLMKGIPIKTIFYAFGIIYFLGCSEAPLLSTDSSVRLNDPVSMALIPGTDFAVVASADINLNQDNGSLMGVDLAGRTLLIDSKVDIPSFSGRMAVDAASQRIFIANKEKEAVLVYAYSIPGREGLPISFEEVPVPRPLENAAHGLRTDESPYDVLIVNQTNRGPLLFTSNIASGSVSIAKADTLEGLDFNPSKASLVGLPLVSAANFQDVDRMPGLGAYRMALDPIHQRLIYVSSTRRNDIYVIDAYDQTIEAMLDLSFLPSTTGTRGLALSSDSKAYVVCPTLQQIQILDVSGVTHNGVQDEVLEPKVIGNLKTGVDPEAVALSADEKTLYVLNQGDPSLYFYDVDTRIVTKRAVLRDVNQPSDFLVNPSRQEIYVLEYISNRLIIIDSQTGAELARIQ